jgi:two-component system cell cycle response regulator
VSAETTRVKPPDEAPPSGAASLVFVEGDALLGLTVELSGEVVLGRDPGCTVSLPADDVSRRHARILPADGGHVVLDLASTNGTWVNGAAVQSHRLVAGDRLRVGSFVATYVAPGDPAGRHLERLAGLARKDPLTGLPNRRALEEELPRALARALRAGEPLSVVVLDVDRFKEVNDRHGHAAGDAVLAAVAGRAAAALRGSDVIARFGGEEFAVVLPGADLARAAEAAERIREAVAAEAVTAGGAALSVTVSLGCATLVPDERDARALLARADARLYEAKRAGRNRVVA